VSDVVVVEVLDRGPGIAVSETESVFAPFHRPASDVLGAGLGLALSRAILRAHGGDLRVGPRPGGGAAFRVTIPWEPAPVVPVDEEREEAS
jgi:signal transduction histidine kinase